MMRGKSKGKVFVGLSGGVDSAVSAALLQKAGYDVTGVFIRITVSGYPCAAGEDRIDAMRVAAHLRIPFVELDLSSAYQHNVFETSLEEFKKGNTPNPDTLCNKEIKFGKLFAFARAQGADFVATGHYAQVHEGKLYASVDTEKDQSYFLWMIPPEVLPRVIFPVGGYRKAQVRKLAEKFMLPNARRKDSQGLCFLGNIPMKDMLEQELSPVPGDVLSETGEVVGTHRGAALYTLGERHGFVLHAQSPDAQPHYVVGKDMRHNTITVAPNPYPQGAAKTRVSLREENWLGELPEGPMRARFRYRQELVPAQLEVIEGSFVVTLAVPRHIPLGQSLVLYQKTPQGERCLGGGIVDKCSFV